jgi:hypothetical protein
MRTSRKIGSFAVDGPEEYILTGNMCGEVGVIEMDRFEMVNTVWAQPGAIEAVAVHPSLPYVASMGMDRSVCLLERTTPSTLSVRDRFVFRDVKCSNDPVPIPYNYSLSQALTFHPTQKRLAVRSGNAGVLEMDFSGGRLEQIHCTRFHDDTDLVTLRYLEDGTLLSGSGGGAVLSRDNVELCSWRFGNLNLHWFEPVADDEYLVACDELYVIRLNIRNRREPVIGRKLTRDDLEHVTYNPTSGRAFAGGFDGTVYEIDPDTCNFKRVAWDAPYKMRWIKTLRTDPDRLIVLCFNGAIYKVGLTDQRVVAQIKETPNAIWTCVRRGKQLLFAGEGEFIRTVEVAGIDRLTASPVFHLGPALHKGDDHSFTKRMVSTESGLLLAQKHGKLLEITENGTRIVADFGEHLRDVAAVPGQSVAFVCTEAGRVLKVDTNTGAILHALVMPDSEPAWALAYHPGRNLLASAGRRGILVIASGEDLTPVCFGSTTARPKRMKWCDDTLLYNQTGVLRKFDLATYLTTDYVEDCENTIEDFIWDEERRYLVLIGYRTEIVLCDFETGAKLSVTPDQADFSKGLEWVSQPDCDDGYPLDFVTFGRTGTAHLYRIHNERCIAMGPIAENLL